MKNILIFINILTITLFLGCGGSGGGNNDNSQIAYPVDITLLVGYIADANMSDSDATPVKYKIDEKIYHFYDKPKGVIKANGGTFESGLANKMTYIVPADTKVITPIVIFLNDYPYLKNVIANALKVDQAYLTRDFIKDDKIQIAKFAQIIYALNIHNLTSQFASKLENASTYSDIAYSAIKVSSGHTQEERIKNFIYALDDKTDVKTLEQDIYSQKSIMQQNVQTPNTNEDPAKPQSFSTMSVKEVDLVGNLKLNVKFSEKIVVNQKKQKDAFSLRQIVNSAIPLDNNANIELSTKSLTLPLKNNLSTENTQNRYILKVKDTFVSSEGLSLLKNEATINPTEKNLILQKIIFVSSKVLKITFNLPIDTQTINLNDFSINSKTLTYKPVSIRLDQNDEKTLIITLGNSLSEDFGYDFVIESENLSATNKTSKLLDNKAKKEFLTKVVPQDDLNNGFNIISANVDEEQKNVTINFSKPIMSNPNQTMFSIELDSTLEPMDLNITDNNGTSNTITIKPLNTLLSPEQNKTSYKLSIAKQSFFSVDGGRTLGSTYEKIFQIKNYPKASANLSTNTINIKFNMSMDLNLSDIKITENNKDANVTLSGNRINYTLSKLTDFNASSTTLIIKSGVLSTDKNYKLEADFIKDFNATN